jgi:hypothetical protein
MVGNETDMEIRLLPVRRSRGVTVTTTDARLMPLILQLGRCAAVTMDVADVLGSVCAAVPGVLGVGGAVILLDSPPGGTPALMASDVDSAWLGELQQSAGFGPLPSTLRTGRPILTADLTRIGPPALAAAAAECGLVSSLVQPIDFDGEQLGALQLLGGVWRPLEPADGEALRPLLDVIAARLVDTRTLRRMAALCQERPTPSPIPRMPSQRIPPDPEDAAITGRATTRSLPVVLPPTDSAESPSSSSTTPRSFAPRLVSPQNPHTP